MNLESRFNARISEITLIALKLEAHQQGRKVSQLVGPLFAKITRKHSEVIEELKQQALDNGRTLEEETQLHLKELGAVKALRPKLKRKLHK